MKAKLILVATVLAVSGMAVQVTAQTPAETPTKVKELRQQFLEERAEVMARILEKRAELLRISSQKDPDVEKVQALVREIGELRDGQRKKCDEYRATMAALRQSGAAPLAGLRPGRGGIGVGYGAGYGQRRAGRQRAWDGPRQDHRRIGRGGLDPAPRGRPRDGRGQRPQFGPGRVQRPGVGPRGPQAVPRRDAPSPRRGAPGARGAGFGRPRQGRMGGPGGRSWGPGTPPPPPVEPPAEAGDQPAE